MSSRVSSFPVTTDYYTPPVAERRALEPTAFFERLFASNSPQYLLAKQLVQKKLIDEFGNVTEQLLSEPLPILDDTNIGEIKDFLTKEIQFKSRDGTETLFTSSLFELLQGDFGDDCKRELVGSTVFFLLSKYCRTVLEHKGVEIAQDCPTLASTPLKDIDFRIFVSDLHAFDAKFIAHMSDKTKKEALWVINHGFAHRSLPPFTHNKSLIILALNGKTVENELPCKVDIAIVEKQPRSHLFILDSLRIPLDAFFLDQDVAVQSIRPVSDRQIEPNKTEIIPGWQAIIDRSLKIIRIDDIESIDQFGWPMLQVLRTKGYVLLGNHLAHEQEIEQKLLKKLLPADEIDIKGIGDALLHCWKNHLHEDEEALVSLAYHASNAMGSASSALSEYLLKDHQAVDRWRFLTAPWGQMLPAPLQARCMGELKTKMNEDEYVAILREYGAFLLKHGGKFEGKLFMQHKATLMLAITLFRKFKPTQPALWEELCEKVQQSDKPTLKLALYQLLKEVGRIDSFALQLLADSLNEEVFTWVNDFHTICNFVPKSELLRLYRMLLAAGVQYLKSKKTPGVDKLKALVTLREEVLPDLQVDFDLIHILSSVEDPTLLQTTMRYATCRIKEQPDLACHAELVKALSPLFTSLSRTPKTEDLVMAASHFSENYPHLLSAHRLFEALIDTQAVKPLWSLFERVLCEPAQNKSTLDAKKVRTFLERAINEASLSFSAEAVLGHERLPLFISKDAIGALWAGKIRAKLKQAQKDFTIDSTLNSLEFLKLHYHKIPLTLKSNELEALLSISFDVVIFLFSKGRDFELFQREYSSLYEMISQNYYARTARDQYESNKNFLKTMPVEFASSQGDPPRKITYYHFTGDKESIANDKIFRLNVLFLKRAIALQFPETKMIELGLKLFIGWYGSSHSTACIDLLDKWLYSFPIEDTPFYLLHLESCYSLFCFAESQNLFRSINPNKEAYYRYLQNEKSPPHLQAKLKNIFK